MLGGVEAGGTKFVCVVADRTGRVEAEERIPTTTPDETLGAVARFFTAAREAGLAVDAVGMAAFGPLDLRGGARHGHLMATPKPGWSGVDMIGPIRDALRVPVAIDTDVNAAALAEARFGAGRGLASLVYVTVGTGIGVGALIDGRPVHGLMHPEAGHVSVPREPGDTFPGVCPFHGDCLEGMASGPALAARWGRPAEELTGADREAAVDLEAAYLASGLRNVVLALAPERVVMGGGVTELPRLVERIRPRLTAAMAGYPGLDAHTDDGFVVPAGLGRLAGARGALALAEDALG